MLAQRVSGGVAWLTLDRPERLNSFTVADYAELRRALDGAAADDAVRVAVVTGAGRAFSAGADRALLEGSDPDLADAGKEFAGFVDVLCSFPKPLLGAANGLAVGIGCTMLLHCDLVLAAASARFRLPFTALGVAPEAGSSVLLPARVRWSDAMWAMLSSEWISADAAYDMGLVWRVVPDDRLDAEAARAAATLAALDPAPVAAAKRLLTAGRLDAVRLAQERELREMSSLMARRTSLDAAPRTDPRPVGGTTP